MTSEERRAARRIRRSIRRAEKKKARMETAGRFDGVFNFPNLFYSYKRCRRGVTWKASVQRYMATAPIQIAGALERLRKGTYRSPGFFEFDLCERGKRRHIRSTVIGERVVQRCLCDNALIPALCPSLIYDNGASMKDKGYHFCMDRLEHHLREHYRKHGTEGYVLLYDFRHFFDSISHEVLKRILDRAFEDQRIKALTGHFIDAFGEVGLGLGSQISQVLALAATNRMDHYIKEKLRIKQYGRYNDDGYLIHHSKAYLKHCLKVMIKICRILKVQLNPKKTQIVKISHGFKWLQARIYLTKTGKVVRKICKKSVVRMRRKLKSMCKKLEQGRMRFKDVYQSFQSWRGYARTFDAWNTVQSMGRLFNNLFIWRMGDAVYQST